jgi:hypothetical protein
LMARSRRACPEHAEGTPRMLILPMLFGPFQPLKPAPGGTAKSFPGAENKNCKLLVMSGG